MPDLTPARYRCGMPIIVVATITPNPGRLQQVIDAFAAVNEKVHAEPGCEFYALHTDGERVVMVERWTTEADLEAHNTGDALKELGGLFDDAVASTEVLRLENRPFGDPEKASIP